MASDMARELRPHHVAAVSIWMGGLDTERDVPPRGRLPPETRDVRRESPEFTGLVIAALYRSPEPMTFRAHADRRGTPPEPHASLR